MIRRTMDVTIVLFPVSINFHGEMSVYIHGPNSKDAHQPQLLLIRHLEFEHRRNWNTQQHHICRNANDSLSNVDTTSINAHCGRQKQRIPARCYRFAREKQAEEDGRVCPDSHCESEPDECLEDLVGVDAFVKQAECAFCCCGTDGVEQWCGENDLDSLSVSCFTARPFPTYP